jgi:hypothetical protein
MTETPGFSRTKRALLENLAVERASLEALLESVPVERQTTPGVFEDWSVKDLIAHFMLWEEWILDRCEQLRQTGEVAVDERDTLPTDEMNQLHHERHRLRPWEDIRHEEREVYARILALIQAFDDDQLFEPKHYAFASGQPLSAEIKNETVGHYRAHQAALAEFAARITE